MNFAFQWARHRWVGVAALAVTSGAAGWTLGSAQDARDAAAAEVADGCAQRVPHTSASSEPNALIEAFADRSPSAPDRVVGQVPREPADEDSAAIDVDLLGQTVIEGTDRERHSALTRALQTGIELPPELLQQTFLSDPSEDVRLLAFTTYVDASSDDRVQVRAILENGVYNDSSAVRAEALRRLEELERYERTLAQA